MRCLTSSASALRLLPFRFLAIFVPFLTVILASPSRAQTPSPPRLNGFNGASIYETGQRVTLNPIFAVTTPAAVPSSYQYQWRKNGTAVPGATSYTLVFEAIADTDTGTYAVTVTNEAGSSTASGNLTVRAAGPIVFTSPPRTQTLQVGQSGFFSFVATGSYPRTYQWLKDGSPIPGATDSFLGLDAITNAAAGSYSITVTNPFGAVTSAIASLTVNAATPLVFFANSPADATITQGASGSLSVRLANGSSPVTYQWSKDGTPVAGATDAQLTFAAAKLTDAGKYSVTATNPAGTVTSPTVATLTIRPATLAAFGNQPVAQSIFQGQSASFTFFLSAGSAPLTYQWTKDGAPISGATDTFIRFDAAKLTDAGTYAAVVTNAAGSVTSAAVPFAVTPAVLPAITQQPAGATLPYGSSLGLYASVTGTPPLTLTWYRDATSVAGGRADYSVSTTTTADSGNYTLVVSNVAGSVTSAVAKIAVSPPAAPVLTRQPASLSVAAGLSAAFSVDYSSVGTGYITTQWFKNGRPIAGANSSANSNYYRNFDLSNVSSADEGDYTIVVTGQGGTVTSQSAHLTVLSANPPSINYWPRDEYASVGDNPQFNLYFVNGSPPLTIQWFKNGVPIPGATGITLYLKSVTDADFGLYSVTVSNAGGVIASPDFALRRYASAKPPWLAAEQFGNIVYLLATAPNRIERYDLTADRWLASTPLTDPRAPTALLPTAEGVYLAYGRSLTRRTLDLAAETPIANAAYDIVTLFTTDQYLYYTTSGPTNGTSGAATSSVHRSILAAGPDLQSTVHSAAFLSGKRQLFATSFSGSGPRLFPVDAQGRLGAPFYYNALEKFPAGAGAIIFPGEAYLATGAGTIFRTSDMTYAGSVGNRPDDLTFLANGTLLVLRDRTLQSLDPATFFLTGIAPELPFRGWRAFTAGTNITVFGAPVAPSSTTFQTTKITAAALTHPSLPIPFIAPSERYSIDDAFLGEDNLVHVLSRSRRALIRWSPTARSFLSPLPLRGAPTFATQTNPAKRAVLGYHDGVLTEVPLRAATIAETQLNTVGNDLLGLTDLGSQLLVNASPSYPYQSLRLTLDQQGKMLSTQSSLEAESGGGAALGVGWEPTRRRLYSGPITIYDEFNVLTTVLSYLTLQPDGVINGASGRAKGVTSPIRFSSDSTFLASGNGRVLNADLTQVGILANDISDAAWLPADLYTVRPFAGGTQIQRWSRSNYLISGTASLPGTPVRLFRLSDTQLLAVTNTQGYPTFTLLNPDLSTAGASTPPSPADYSGTYFATITSTRSDGLGRGDLALYVRPDRSAVLLVHLADYGGDLTATDFTINNDGSFTATAIANSGLPFQTRQTYSGLINSSGAIVGTGDTNGYTNFAGTKATGTNPAAGYYFASLLNANSGGVSAIVGGDGRALVLARNLTTYAGGTATVNPTSRLTIPLQNSATLTVTLNPTNGAITATADRDAFATSQFAGLRDGAPHTDRLANISTRGLAGPSDDVMIAGFVLTGAAPRPVLIRAIGPTLGTFGVPNVLADPRLSLYRGTTQLSANDNWSTPATAPTIVPSVSAEIAATTARVGGFALAAGSADAALLVTLDPGAYTAQVSAPAGAALGNTLVEVYDAGPSTTPAATDPRLINIATRGRLATPGDTLIAGIVVTGNAPKRLLIRAIGPGLAAFGVPGTLSDPLLTLISGTVTVATNNDWNDTTNTNATPAEVSAAAASAGAFALPNGSKDACLLLTLAPGNYTAQVTGNNATTGIALVEVYEVNN